MNQKRKHLSDAMPETPEVSQRLDEIEQRLKATRPQSTQLDLVALQQAADSAATVEHPTARKSRGALVIAGSWMCGVAVGAIVMFVLMSLAARTEIANDHVVYTEPESPGAKTLGSVDDFLTETDSDLPFDAAALVNAVPRKTGVSLSATTFDPLATTDSTYATDGPTLQAGAHFKRTVSHPTWPFGLSVQQQRESVNQYELGPSEMRTKASFDWDPKSPVSRRELMQEFLQESSESVL
jgi:hypothetical protein